MEIVLLTAGTLIWLLFLIGIEALMLQLLYGRRWWRRY